MYGKVVNVIYDIDAGDLESILQCCHKFNVAEGALRRGIKAIMDTVSH